MSTSRGSVGHAVYPSARRSCLEIEIAPSAVRIARRWTTEQLSADPAVSDELVAAATLAVSELVTNAIRAVSRVPALPVRLAPLRGSAPLRLGELSLAGPRVSLVISCLDGAVRIEVHDSCCAALPPVRQQDEDDESGRGLTVVSALAANWGWRPATAGKVVWCELRDAGCSPR